MKLKQSLSQLICAALLLPILASCQNNGGDQVLEKAFQNLSQSANVSDWAKSEVAYSQAIHEHLKTSTGEFPKLRALPKDKKTLNITEAKKLHDINSQETLPIIDQQKKNLMGLVDNVTRLSKVKFSKGMATQTIGEAETILALNLLAVRSFSEAQAQNTLLMMTKFDRSYFDQVESNATMKKRLLSDYIAALSTSTIATNDLKKTLEGLGEMRANKLLTPVLEQTLDKVVKATVKRENTAKTEIGSYLEQNLPADAKAELNNAITKYQSSIKNKTFLYDPANPDHPLVHVLVIVSNMTWGLVNSMVGLGFVVATTIVAPITTVTALIIRAFGYEPIFHEVRLPRIGISDNNMQLYADVCGMGVPGAKMSAGLFELDFCTEKGFASGHEGGHAKQSAILGPLYFPAAILSYALNMGHGGFIESWADGWEVH